MIKQQTVIDAEEILEDVAIEKGATAASISPGDDDSVIDITSDTTSDNSSVVIAPKRGSDE